MPLKQYVPALHCETPVRRAATPPTGVEKLPAGMAMGADTPAGQYLSALPQGNDVFNGVPGGQ